MSNYTYNPIPPRVWSRVQNQCTYTVPGSDYTQAFIPLTGQTVSQAQADYETKQIYKGNVLQYKGNSARLTKSQKYSQLARCAGPNRTKVFATQSETYTNPNTTGLLRVGTQTYPYPNQIVGAPNNISGPFEYNIPNPNDCSGNSVQDGGTLVCGTFANPCTGEIIKQGISSATICNPASASDVPGSSILCWNNKVQTWFPKPRYAMNNSTDKWPFNYKGFVSAIQINSPYLNIDTNCNNAILNWTSYENCIYQVIRFDIYNDRTFIKSVSYNVTSTTVQNLNANQTYLFRVAAVVNISGINELYYSNIVNCIITPNLNAPTGLSGTAGNQQINISWIAPSSDIACPITNYKIYYNNNSIIIGNVTSYILTGLENGTTYNIFVAAINPTGEGTSSNIISLIPFTVPTKPLNLQGTKGYQNITLIWNAPLNNGGSSITNYKIYYNSNSIIVGNITSFNLTGLTSSTPYNIYVTAINNAGEGPPSDIINISTGSANPDPPYNFYTPGPNYNSFEAYWNQPLYSGDSPFSHYILYITYQYTPPPFYQNNNYTLSSYGTNGNPGTYTLYITSVNTNGNQSTSLIGYTEILEP